MRNGASPNGTRQLLRFNGQSRKKKSKTYEVEGLPTWREIPAHGSCLGVK